MLNSPFKEQSNNFLFYLPDSGIFFFFWETVVVLQFLFSELSKFVFPFFIVSAMVLWEKRKTWINISKYGECPTCLCTVMSSFKKCICEHQWWVMFNLLRYLSLLDVIQSWFNLSCPLPSRRTIKIYAADSTILIIK